MLRCRPSVMGKLQLTGGGLLRDRDVMDWWRRLGDQIAHRTTLACLWVLDRVAGPEPPSKADIERERLRARLRRAFPSFDIDGTILPRRRTRRFGRSSR
jgi:hypothetical protein